MSMRNPAAAISENNAFLLTQAEARQPDARRKIHLLDPRQIALHFPDCRVGKSFPQDALDVLQGVLTFAVMLIQIRGFETIESPQERAGAARMLLDTAAAIAAVSRPGNGIWGLIDKDTFGVFFPESCESFCLDHASAVRAGLPPQSASRVAIGVTEYPLKHFTRAETLANARKALIHAHLSTPDPTAAFNAVSLNICGDNRYQEGDVTGAIAEFNSALVLDPANTNVLNSLGVCYGTMGNHDAALKSFLKAHAIQPQEMMPLYNAAMVHKLMDQEEKAAACLLKALDIAPSAYEIHSQLGRLYLKKGEHGAALNHLEAAAAIRPASGACYRYVGECYFQMNNLNKALKAYQKAVQCNPNDPEALSMLGHIFDLLGENVEIATVFSRHAVAVSPDNGLFRNRLGRLYLKQDLLAEALVEFTRAHELGCDSSAHLDEIRTLRASQAG